MTGLTDEEKIQKVLQHRADVRESERCYEKHYGLFQLTQMTRIRMEQFSDKLRFPTLIGYKYGIDKDTIEVVFDALAFNEVTYNGNLMDEMARVLRAPIPERISGLTGAVRYLTHMDNPEKYQYDNTEIQVFGGFDLESC
ncbi:MAG: Rep family protein, partial [Ligilactobacillus agilis]|nr:Rep family protein [Ligilactobacillus agilis]